MNVQNEMLCSDCAANKQLAAFLEDGPYPRAGSLEQLFLMLIYSAQDIDVNCSPLVPEETEALASIFLHGCEYILVKRLVEPSKPGMLSRREQEIVHLVAAGLPNKCIASALDISIWTVATHLRRIFVKLGVNSRAAMIARVSDCKVDPAAVKVRAASRVNSDPHSRKIVIQDLGTTSAS